MERRRVPSSPTKRVPIAGIAVSLLLVTMTAAAVWWLLPKGRVSPPTVGEGGRVFYIVPYHYGFAFYDQDFAEVRTMTVRVGEHVTLYIVPALALSEQTFMRYAERTIRAGIAELPPQDPRIRAKILEDLSLGNVEHIVGLSAHPVFVTTKVAAVLNGRSFRPDAPASVREAVERRDATIVGTTFTAKRSGRFDVICLDADPLAGTGTCGWGHKWMIARGAFVVEK